MPSVPDLDDLGLLEPIEPHFTRQEASDYGRDKYKISTTPRSFEALPIPYVVVRGRALYAKSDLDAYFRNLLSNAARRIGRPASPRPLDRNSGIRESAAGPTSR
jgi:hypothetical protein